jgi:hypothetical protein
LNVHGGHITHPALAKALNRTVLPLDQALG